MFPFPLFAEGLLEECINFACINELSEQDKEYYEEENEDKEYCVS